MKLFGGMTVDVKVGENVGDRAIKESFAYDPTTRPRYTIQILVHALKHGATTQIRDARIEASVYLWHRGTGGFAVSETLLGWCGTAGCLGLADPGFTLTDEEQRIIPQDSWNDSTEWPVEVQRRAKEYETAMRMCPVCKVVYRRGDMPDTMFYRDTYTSLAEDIDRIWVNTKGSADIFKTTFKHAHGFHEARNVLGGGESYAVVKSARAKTRECEMALYHNAAIIKDLSSGTTVTKLVESFLRA